MNNLKEELIFFLNNIEKLIDILYRPFYWPDYGNRDSDGSAFSIINYSNILMSQMRLLLDDSWYMRRYASEILSGGSEESFLPKDINQDWLNEIYWRYRMLSRKGDRFVDLEELVTQLKDGFPEIQKLCLDKIEIINKAELMVVLHMTSKTADYLYTAVSKLSFEREDCDIYSDLCYLQCRQEENDNQKTIQLKKNAVILSKYSGRLKAAKEFADKYCPDLNAVYLLSNNFKKHISKKMDFVLVFENNWYDGGMIEEITDKYKTNVIMVGLDHKRLVKLKKKSPDENKLFCIKDTHDLDLVFSFAAAVL